MRNDRIETARKDLETYGANDLSITSSESGRVYFITFINSVGSTCHVNKFCNVWGYPPYGDDNTGFELRDEALSMLGLLIDVTFEDFVV